MAPLTIALLLFTLPAAVDVTGKWSGTFDVQTAQGESRTSPIFMTLKQEGGAVSGSGGPNEGEQHPIQNGKIEGDRITFEVPLSKGTIHFDLKATETEIRGEMRRSRDGSTETAKVSLKRADAK
jgi:hypothetical protein